MNKIGTLLGCGILLLVVATLPTDASSGGITGFSGNPASGGAYCTVCHSGGVVPTVVLTGPSVVAPGTIHTYTLTISGGQQVEGGFDVSANAGTLSLDPGDSGTREQSGEITHNTPRPVNGNLDVVWTFRWQAPVLPGMATLFAAGNSKDNMAGNSGDNAATTGLQITIGGAAGTPGESSAPSLQPLRVTAYDNLTGAITISYESGCDTDDNNVYYGALDQVASLGWTDEICDIGTSGSAVIQPTGGSLFFLVVGNSGGKDGSYGKNSEAIERPPLILNTCGESQDLSNSCSP